MDCAKSIDELYDEVKDYDLVVTNDAALATALNGRVDKPIVGPFAMTPQWIAGVVGSEVIKAAPYRDLSIITTVAAETGLDFRYVHSEIENIKEIRRHTESVDKYMYTANSKDVWRSFIAIPSEMKVMAEFNPNIHKFYENFEKIAVIGIDLFNDLDKHFIPNDFKEIDLFKDGDFQIDEIYEIGNDRQIAENAVSLMDPEKATDYAIVLNSDSALTDAVRSALYRRHIPFVNSLTVKDLAQIRDYLQFVSLSLSFRTLRVRQVRELLLTYNGYVDADKDKVLLTKILATDISDNTRSMLELMRDISDYTFGEVIMKLKHAGSPQVKMILDQMELTDMLVTPRRVSDLAYAVNNVSDLEHNEQIPEYEKSGVLITDCKNSVYIDRPVIFYLGMEQDWNIPIIGKKYLDVEAENEKNVLRLKLLIQQGEKRIFCVNTTKNGRKARPALNFDQIIGEAADSFSKICKHLVRGHWATSKPAVELKHEEIDVNPDDEFKSPFSKSTFDSYMDCPRKFMFKSLIPTPDEKYTEFGTLLHEFAELYACYPEKVREDGLDTYVRKVSDEYSGLSSSLMEPLDDDKIRLSMKNIMRFLDKHGLTNMPLDIKNSLREHKNGLMEEMGLDMSSSRCESEENPRNLPIHGYLDVYANGVVYDYKTGRAKDSGELVRMMNVDSKQKYIDFQPLFYLAMVADHPGNRG